MIYFVHNYMYFHLVIFHWLFDHLVQWIILDITKRPGIANTFCRSLGPSWYGGSTVIHSMNFVLLIIKTCERQGREGKNHVIHRSPRSILSSKWQKRNFKHPSWTQDKRSNLSNWKHDELLLHGFPISINVLK